MIKNIIFDIGNVLLRFNRDYLLSQFYQGTEFEYVKDIIFKDWEKMDDNTLTPAEHLQSVLNVLPTKYHQIATSLLTTWEDYMIYSDGIIDLVKELKEKGYKLYILSNMTTHFIERESKFEILKYFDGIVYSAPIKIMKPDPAIYEYILTKYSLNPTECLFVDDMKTNLTEAARFGIKTFLFNNNAQELKKYISSL